MTSGATTTRRRRRTAVALTSAVATAVGGTFAAAPVTAAPGTPDASGDGGMVSSAPELRLVPLPGGDLAALDVPLSGRGWTAAGPRGSAATARTAPMRTSSFSMVGFTWRGEGADIRVRTRQDGDWGGWVEVEALDDGPDRSAGEGKTDLGATDALWVGPSNGIEVEVAGTRPRRFEMALIDPGSDPAPDSSARAAATEVEAPAARKATRPDRAPRPPIRGRKAWKADNSWRDGGPWYNRTIQQVHIHHTASGTSYRKRDVPGLIRGMYRYHTYNLGWSDIGYNFLVDRFGRRWVGRAGGAAKAVRGAHTLGFNSTSVGIAVIGNFEQRKPRQKVLTSLVRLAAWKLDPYDRRARSRVKVYSHGSDKYPEGTKPRLKTIDGHRDTNDTACPGQKVYDRLPGVRRRTAERIKRYS